MTRRRDGEEFRDALNNRQDDCLYDIHKNNSIRLCSDPKEYGLVLFFVSHVYSA
jgi:hypothetical protein